MSYEPQPGTIPHRAIEHLKTLPAGAEISTAVFCGGLGQSTNNFPAVMRPAVDGGAVRSRRKPGTGGNLLWWSLGDGTHVKREEEPDSEDEAKLDAAARRQRRSEPPVIPIVDPGKWKLPFADEKPEIVVGGVGPPLGPHRCEHGILIVDECKACAIKLSGEVQAESVLPPIEQSAPLPCVRAGTAPARWGIFDDGAFHIQKAGTEIVLERAELERMVAFLERMAVAS